MGRRLAPQPSRFSCWLRRLWPDRNPLRRTSDRVEAAVAAWLAVALLVGVPLAALSAGRLSYDAGVRAEHAQRRSQALMQDRGQALGLGHPAGLARNPASAAPRFKVT
jgi:hypothetical protein